MRVEPGNPISSPAGTGACNFKRPGAITQPLNPTTRRTDMPAKAASVIEKTENGFVVVETAIAGARCATRAETIATITRMADRAIHDAVEMGGALEEVATGLVQGAIHCAKDLEITVED